LALGEDFYMQPAWHPDGNRLAWIAWNHPNMPWDGTYLRLSKLNFEGSLPALEEIETIAGGETISIFQPEFSPDGRFLAYVSDASGWWQLYLYDLENRQHRQLTYSPSEHGLPAWTQGVRTYGFHPHEQRLFFLRSQSGIVRLWQYDFDSGVEECLLSGDPYTDLSQICVSAYGLAMLASGDRVPPRVISYAFTDAQESRGGQVGDVQVIRRSSSEELPVKIYSTSQSIQWSGMDGGIVHGLIYAPNHPDYESRGKPPLVVLVHGGPTGQAIAAFDPRAQFFASRGYAVLEVNFRGSAGYGRAYRDKLRGNWGIYDVEDAVSGAKDLAGRGVVDGKKMAIMGSSAGGFTVLKALEDYPGVFKVGICMYGISNHFTLVEEIHKFEAHYSDSLLGPLPEAAEVYRQRSPIFFADRIRDALALFQGEDDVVVPREQSDEFAKALRQLGVPYIYRIYPGEGHGFRKDETIEDLYSTIESFLRQYFIFA
jgi:dipeptidyl aminopeptidase/acylaminoacyl peptidase